jgi:hypothetical protein
LLGETEEGVVAPCVGRDDAMTYTIELKIVIEPLIHVPDGDEFYVGMRG